MKNEQLLKDNIRVIKNLVKMTWSIGKFNNKESEASGKVHLGKACVSLNNGEVMG